MPLAYSVRNGPSISFINAPPGTVATMQSRYLSMSMFLTIIPLLASMLSIMCSSQSHPPNILGKACKVCCSMIYNNNNNNNNPMNMDFQSLKADLHDAHKKDLDLKDMKKKREKWNQKQDRKANNKKKFQQKPNKVEAKGAEKPANNSAEKPQNSNINKQPKQPKQPKQNGQMKDQNDEQGEGSEGEEGSEDESSESEIDAQERENEIKDLLLQAKDGSSYQPGKFSSFAIKIQKSLNEKNDFIAKTIKEAVLSYELKLRQNFSQIQNKLGLTKLNQQAPFQTQQQIQQFLKNQSEFYMKRIFINTKEKQSSTHIGISNIMKAWKASQFVSLHYKRKQYIANCAFVQGKAINISKIKLSQRFYFGKNLFLPTQVDNLYIKLGQKSDPVKVILKKGQFLQERQFIMQGQQLKDQIFSMVILYLKSQKILIDEKQLQRIKVVLKKQIQNKQAQVKDKQK